MELGTVKKTHHENVRVLRAKHNISQKDLAKALNINASTLSMIENGGNVPRLELAYKIANFFGKSIDEVFYSEM